MSAFRTTLPPPLRADVLYEWSHSQSGRKVPAESLQVRMGVFDRENPNETGALTFGVTEVISHKDYIGAVYK